MATLVYQPTLYTYDIDFHLSAHQPATMPSNLEDCLDISGLRLMFYLTDTCSLLPVAVSRQKGSLVDWKKEMNSSSYLHFAW